MKSLPDTSRFALGWCVSCRKMKYVRLAHVHGKHYGMEVGLCPSCDKELGEK